MSKNALSLFHCDITKVRLFLIPTNFSSKKIYFYFYRKNKLIEKIYHEKIDIFRKMKNLSKISI